jgi:hypothetical protein
MWPKTKSQAEKRPGLQSDMIGGIRLEDDRVYRYIAGSAIAYVQGLVIWALEQLCSSDMYQQCRKLCRNITCIPSPDNTSRYES